MTKSNTLLLAGSLALNGILGAVAWQSPASPAAKTAPVAPAAAVAASQPAAAKASAAAPASAPRPPLWDGLPAVIPASSIDDAIARLRRAGCPPQEIVAAVRVMIDEISRAKRSALGFANETLPYWKQFQRFNEPRPPNEFNDMILESIRLTRTYLLTPELFPADEAQVVSARARFGDVDLEKLRRLAVIESEFNEKSFARMSTNSAKPGEARYAGDTQNNYQELERQKNDAFAAVLSPAEFTEYELRNSSAAANLRFRMDVFKPTEEEYKALFALEKSRRATINTPNPLTPEQRRAAEEQYLAAAKAALSPERAADFEALMKAGGDQLPRLIARLDLPLVTVTYLNTMREQTNSRARAIQADASLTPEQKTFQLTTLANEAESQIGSTLGSQRALDAYKDLKGEWLRNLRNPSGR